jgi:hypothetical protein
MERRIIRGVDMPQSTHQTNKEKRNPTLLGILDSTTSFADKVELIRSSNPYFYLLTPKPKKESK